MSLADTIAAFLSVADQVAGETIFYQRPGNEAVPIEDVRRGNTRVEVNAGDVTAKGRVHDWLIEAVRLVVPGVPYPTPWAADLIIVECSNKKQIYEVRPPRGFDSHWEWHDPHGQWYRIHTQYLATE